MKLNNFDSGIAITIIMGLFLVIFLFYEWYSNPIVEFDKLVLINGVIGDVDLSYTDTDKIISFTVTSSTAFKRFRFLSGSFPSFSETSEMIETGNNISIWYSPDDVTDPTIWQIEINKSFPQKYFKVNYADIRKVNEKSESF